MTELPTARIVSPTTSDRPRLSTPTLGVVSAFGPVEVVRQLVVDVHVADVHRMPGAVLVVHLPTIWWSVLGVG